MKKIITAALLAAVALPAAAQAQSQREIRHDRHDVHQEQRDVNRARQNGNPQQVRHEQRELAGARQELREDQRDRARNWGQNDWQGYRNGNRGTFSRGNWRAPFRYQSFRPGLRIGFDLFGPRYRISDPWRYHLPAAGYGQVWVRHYDDLLLVDTRRGVVVRVIRNFYW
jgi:Ni/Co efflux regulator RcnB